MARRKDSGPMTPTSLGMLRWWKKQPKCLACQTIRRYPLCATCKRNGYTVISAEECSSLKMTTGNERKFQVIIDKGYRKQWVGIGWVTEDKATPDDYQKYPILYYR